MMKRVSIGKMVCTLCGELARAAALAVIFGALVFQACGCSSYEQPGETAAEGHRRHERIARTNQQELMSDIDTFFLLDRPSKLTDKRIP
jgi:hypothetical protein